MLDDNYTVEYIDNEEGNPSIFYSYVCPACTHMLKTHVFHMLAPNCTVCGTKTRHWQTEHMTIYQCDSDAWRIKEYRLEHGYPLYNVQSIYNDDWSDDDIHHVRVLEVEGRRGVKVFAYDQDDVPLSLISYYDDVEMLQEILER